MIKRSDMLELTRRMTVERTNISRIAGCYVDADGEFDGSFNTSFLKLSAGERAKNLKLAKAVPFASPNEELKEYKLSLSDKDTAEIYRLLSGIKECGLKNDALLDVFYDMVMEKAPLAGPYAIFLFYGIYDVPLKSTAGEYQYESEEVYEYIICSISPLAGEYEPGFPCAGFLFPAFSDRSADLRKIYVYRK